MKCKWIKKILKDFFPFTLNFFRKLREKRAKYLKNALKHLMNKNQTMLLMHTKCMCIQSGAKEGLHLWTHKTQFIHVLWFISYYIIFHTNDSKPTFAHKYIHKDRSRLYLFYNLKTLWWWKFCDKNVDKMGSGLFCCSVSPLNKEMFQFFPLKMAFGITISQSLQFNFSLHYYHHHHHPPFSQHPWNPAD